MIALAIAHLRHRRLRTALSVLAVGIGIAMLLVMLGMSHGMLDEVATRVESVDAELIVLPENENVIFTAGAAFSGKMGPLIEAFEYDGRRVVRRAIGVMLDTLYMGGQQQRLFAVDVADMPAFLGQRKIVEGRLFDQGRVFGERLDALRNENGYYDPALVGEQELLAACELVIDTRLARVGRYRVGDKITFLGRPFTIVGVVESGVAGRVFCPIQVLQFVKNGGVPWVSLFFVQLEPPGHGPRSGSPKPSSDASASHATPPGESAISANPERAYNDSNKAGVAYTEAVADALAARIKAKVELKGAYRELMYESFAQVYTYINLASGVALVVCFIIILLSMYTMVLERTREIGILRALGAGRAYMIGLSVVEALIVCVTGTGLGIAFAFAAKFGIEGARPLLTVSIEPAMIAVALAIGIVGGAISALYPGYRAARLDPVAALAHE